MTFFLKFQEIFFLKKVPFFYHYTLAIFSSYIRLLPSIRRCNCDISHIKFSSSAKILYKTVSVYTLKVKNMIPKFLYSSQLDHSGKNLVAFPVYEANLKTGEIIAYNNLKSNRGSKETTVHSPIRH